MEQQSASFHLRSAELYLDKGARGARGAIKHAKQALAIGADPELAYMFRANAYLLLDRTEDCRRDLGALLEASPEHEAGLALQRSIDAYKAAVDAAAELERSKKWADALIRYSDALDALPAELTTGTVRKGLCRMYLKVRNYVEAVTWCAKAHSANPANIDQLFKHANARAANGEEHAALQLLKTALVNYPRNDRVEEVRERALELEQRLKDRNKVDYYKDLGVPRAASALEVKKAYHSLAMKWHPDRKKGDDDEKHEEMFKRISRAYEILGDADLRSRYDAGEDVEEVLFNQQQQQPGGA